VNMSPLEGIKATEVYIWNHGYPMNIVLTYYLEGGPETEIWVSKLESNKDVLREDLIKKFVFENVIISIDKMDADYNISIQSVVGEAEFKLMDIEKHVVEAIGEFPE